MSSLAVVVAWLGVCLLTHIIYFFLPHLVINLFMHPHFEAATAACREVQVHRHNRQSLDANTNHRGRNEKLTTDDDYDNNHVVGVSLPPTY